MIVDPVAGVAGRPSTDPVLAGVDSDAEMAQDEEDNANYTESALAKEFEERLEGTRFAGLSVHPHPLTRRPSQETRCADVRVLC